MRYCIRSAQLVALLLGFLLTTQVQAMPDSFADLAAEQRKSVVNISTTKRERVQLPGMQNNPFGGSPFEQFFHDFFGQMPERESHALGTGFVISAKGYIVTNNHVVEGADEIIVKTSDGEEYPAELVGTDSKLDVALIKITKAKGKRFQPVRLGNSDQLRVGDWVVAIGNPFGLEQTVTAGIVSARGRVIGSGPYDDFIQTDAAINPGNSGGPLFNVNGEVIGINTAIYSRSGGNNGIGFAIPINLARTAFEQLREYGHVQRGRIGVFIRDVDKETMKALGLKNRRGALVPQVEAGSAADRAGIEAGDVITAVDGEALKNSHDLPIRIARHHPGDRVVLDVVRNGHHLKIPVIVEEMTEEHASSKGGQGKATELSSLGMQLQPATPQALQQLGAAVQYGLIVKRVLRGSPAAARGINPGDVIYKVNGERVKTLQAFRRILNALDDGEVLRILMDRHGNQAFRILRPLNSRN